MPDGVNATIHIQPGMEILYFDDKGSWEGTVLCSEGSDEWVIDWKDEEDTTLVTSAKAVKLRRGWLREHKHAATGCRLINTGTRLKVWWPDDQCYYAGVVQGVDKNTHSVLYNDGEEEKLDLRHEKFEVIVIGNASEEQGKTRTKKKKKRKKVIDGKTVWRKEKVPRLSEHVSLDSEHQSLPHSKPAPVVTAIEISNKQLKRNTKPPGKSGFYGVYKAENTGKWAAGIAVGGGKQKMLGRFNTKEEAASVRDQAVKILGMQDYMLLNF
jgi:hypothetical protein